MKKYLVPLALFTLLMGLIVPAFPQSQAEINGYGTSFNRNLLGQAELLESFLLQPDGSLDFDVFVPVWGRGVTLGVWEASGCPKHDMFKQYPNAAGLRSVNLFTDEGFHLPSLPHNHPDYVPFEPRVLLNFDESPNDSAWRTDPLAHANSTFARFCPNAIGARGATEIQCWWGHQLHSAFLPWMCGTPEDTEFQPADVYVATYMSNASVDEMRALEKASDDFDVSFVYATGNGPGTLNAGQTTVFGDGQSMYNAISVGAAPTTFDEYPTSYSTAHYTSPVGTSWGYGTEGRMKPDICSVGHTQTSFLAPIVGAMSARLREAAVFHFGEETAANKSEVNKAILLSGATKTINYDTPHPLHGDRWDEWSRTPERPLDLRFGAGVANIAKSYEILRAGPGQVLQYGTVGTSLDTVPGPYVASNQKGWASDTIDAGQRKIIHFPPGGLRDFHFTLTWNLEITQLEGGTEYEPDSTRLHYETDARLADLNLKLIAFNSSGNAWIMDESRSAIDNVEHLHNKHMHAMNSAESYAVVIENTSGFAADFALAWRAEESNRPIINIFSPASGYAYDTTFEISGWIDDESEIASVETAFARWINGQWFFYQADGSLGASWHLEALPTFPWLLGAPAFNTTVSVPPAGAGEGIPIWIMRVVDEHGNTAYTAGSIQELD